MKGKDLLIAKFVSDIGTLDGIIETGSISRKCSLDTFNENIATSAIITTSTYGSRFPIPYLGIAGGGISAFSAAVNIGGNKQITANDLFTLLAGAVGVLAASQHI